MQNVKQPQILRIDLFSNLPVMDSWWKKIRMPTRLSSIIMITWVPLLVLSTIENALYELSPTQSFIHDYAVHMRFLVALPLLLLSCLNSGSKIRKILQHFIDANIIEETERGKFQDQIADAMRLRDSRFAKIILLVFIYTLTFFYFKTFAALDVETWRTMIIRGDHGPTRAGWWFMLVSQPLYHYALFYFIYRVLIWARLLFKISRLNLKLSPINGDGIGGLGFVEGSIKTFVLPVFAISTSLAGGMINLVLYDNFQMNQLKILLILLISVYLLLFVGPLFFFTRPLKKAKSFWAYQYGIMLGQIIPEFEKSNEFRDPHFNSVGYESLDASIALVDRAHSMRIYPMKIKLMIPIVLAMVLPFLPVVALKVPWKVILQHAVKLIL